MQAARTSAAVAVSSSPLSHSVRRAREPSSEGADEEREEEEEEEEDEEDAIGARALAGEAQCRVTADLFTPRRRVLLAPLTQRAC